MVVSARVPVAEVLILSGIVFAGVIVTEGIDGMRPSPPAWTRNYPELAGQDFHSPIVIDHRTGKLRPAHEVPYRQTIGHYLPIGRGRTGNAGPELVAVR